MSVETSNRLPVLAARIADCQTKAKAASVEAAEQSLEAGRGQYTPDETTTSCVSGSKMSPFPPLFR